MFPLIRNALIFTEMMQLVQTRAARLHKDITDKQDSIRSARPIAAVNRHDHLFGGHLSSSIPPGPLPYPAAGPRSHRAAQSGGKTARQP